MKLNEEITKIIIAQTEESLGSLPVDANKIMTPEELSKFNAAETASQIEGAVYGGYFILKDILARYISDKISTFLSSLPTTGDVPPADAEELTESVIKLLSEDDVMQPIFARLEKDVALSPETETKLEQARQNHNNITKVSKMAEALFPQLRAIRNEAYGEFIEKETGNSSNYRTGTERLKRRLNMPIVGSDLKTGGVKI